MGKGGDITFPATSLQPLDYFTGFDRVPQHSGKVAIIALAKRHAAGKLTADGPTVLWRTAEFSSSAGPFETKFSASGRGSFHPPFGHVLLRTAPANDSVTRVADRRRNFQSLFRIAIEDQEPHPRRKGKRLP